MRTSAKSVAIGVIMGSSVTCAVMLSLGLAPADQSPSLHRTSYAIGNDLARTTLLHLNADAVEFDAPSLVRGFEDGILGRDPAFTPEQIRASLTVLEPRGVHEGGPGPDGSRPGLPRPRRRKPAEGQGVH